MSGVAFEFKQIDLAKRLAYFAGRVFLLKVSVYYSNAHILVTVIVFLVSVPVLSEQILSAPPMVSHACKYLTKLF